MSGPGPAGGVLPAICDGCGFPKARCQCLELALLQAVRFAGLPEPVREFPFAHPRKYRADFAWPDARLLVEVEGGVYRGGKHGTVTGIKGDIEKGNVAVLLGWRVLRFHGDQIRDGSALSAIEEALR